MNNYQFSTFNFQLSIVIKLGLKGIIRRNFFKIMLQKSNDFFTFAAE